MDADTLELLAEKLESKMIPSMKAGINTSFSIGVASAFIGFGCFWGVINVSPPVFGLLTKQNIECKVNRIKEQYMVCGSGVGEEVFKINDVRVSDALDQIGLYSKVTINVRGIGIFGPREVTEVRKSN
jgi:hypothetical protein